jgi:hypothetical protein
MNMLSTVAAQIVLLSLAAMDAALYFNLIVSYG